MVGILLETDYASSLWGQNMYNSLTKKLRANRISYCHIEDCVPSELDTVFMIASNKNWSFQAIKQLNNEDVRPILLCSQYESLPGCIYSCVCSDIDTAMKNLLDSLKKQGKNRIALYGMNSQSIGDTGRVNSLLTWKDSCFNSMKIFNNNGSLENCFNEFYLHIDEFDAVICANDFVAVSLVKKIKEREPERLDEMLIVSCVANRLSDYYRQYITSLNIDFEQYGQAALYIYREHIKHPYLTEITTKIACTLNSDHTRSKHSSFQLKPIQNDDSFYNDSELKEMLIVDKYLTLSDATEQSIVEGFIQGLSYNDIAEKCFFTISGIKYRTQNLLERIGAESKAQLIELLKRYL